MILLTIIFVNPAYWNSLVFLTILVSFLFMLYICNFSFKEIYITLAFLWFWTFALNVALFHFSAPASKTHCRHFCMGGGAASFSFNKNFFLLSIQWNLLQFSFLKKKATKANNCSSNYHIPFFFSLLSKSHAVFKPDNQSCNQKSIRTAGPIVSKTTRIANVSSCNGGTAGGKRLSYRRTDTTRRTSSLISLRSLSDNDA